MAGGRTRFYHGIEIPHFTERGVTSFFCQLYGFRTSNIVEVRYKAFMRMCSGTGREFLARIKKINSSSPPPCTKTLSNHIKRAGPYTLIPLLRLVPQTVDGS